MYPYLFFLSTLLFHSFKLETVPLLLSKVTSSIYMTDSSPPLAFSTGSSSFPDHSHKHKNILKYGPLKKPYLTRPPITLHLLAHLCFSEPTKILGEMCVSLLSTSYSVHSDYSSLTAVPLLHWNPSCKGYQRFLYSQTAWTNLFFYANSQSIHQSGLLFTF